MSGCFVEAWAESRQDHRSGECDCASHSGGRAGGTYRGGDLHAPGGRRDEAARTAEAGRPAHARDGAGAATPQSAFIGTIHAFCANLLRQRPVEACVRFRISWSWIRGRRGGCWRLPPLDRAPAGLPVANAAAGFARLAWRDNPNAPVSELEAAAWNLAEWRDHDAPWEKREIGRELRITSLLVQARKWRRSGPRMKPDGRGESCATSWSGWSVRKPPVLTTWTMRRARS